MCRLYIFHFQCLCKKAHAFLFLLLSSIEQRLHPVLKSTSTATGELNLFILLVFFFFVAGKVFLAVPRPWISQWLLCQLFGLFFCFPINMAHGATLYESGSVSILVHFLFLQFTIFSKELWALGISSTEPLESWIKEILYLALSYIKNYHRSHTSTRQLVCGEFTALDFVFFFFLSQHSFTLFNHLQGYCFRRRVPFPSLTVCFLLFLCI